MHSYTGKIETIAAHAAIAAVLTYHFLLFALIFIRPEMDVYSRTLSEYAIGPYGWMMSLAFLTSGVSYGCLFVAVKPHLRGILGHVGLVILFLCFIGTIGVGAFTTDSFDTAPENMTVGGIIHAVSGFGALVLLPFAALLINLNLARNGETQSVRRRILIWTAGLPLFGLAGFFLHLSMYVIPLEVQNGPGVPLGWPPRLLFIVYMVWLITLARQLVARNDSMR